MQQLYFWLQEKKKDEQKSRNEEHQKLLDRMFASAEGGGGGKGDIFGARVHAGLGTFFVLANNSIDFVSSGISDSSTEESPLCT